MKIEKLENKFQKEKIHKNRQITLNAFLVTGRHSDSVVQTAALGRIDEGQRDLTAL